VTELDELVAVLEGPGSRPVRSNGVDSRGMLNTPTSPSPLARGHSIESPDNRLYVAQHRLPALEVGQQIQVGAIDAAAVTPADPTFLVKDRVPQDDGLLHAITLDQGVVL
jgi:hypothetical protein